MQQLNYVYFIIITTWALKLLFQKSGKVVNPLNKNEYLQLEGTELFWVLLFSTGLIALSAPGTLDLMAIRLMSLEFMLIVSLMFVSTNKSVLSFASFVYLLYLFWLVYGITYSKVPEYGFRVLLKYLYPFLVMQFASATIRDEEVFWLCVKWLRRIALVALSFYLIPKIENLIPGVFWYGTAACMHFIVIISLSVALYIHNGKKISDLVIAVLFGIPCVLWVFRTSILGTTIALIVLFLFKYKIKALPIIIGVILLFVTIVFSIPSVKEKMFVKSEEVQQNDLVDGNIDKDMINSNGRFAMWDWAKEKFFYGHELQGSGLGTLQECFYSLRHPFGSIRICHNDYIQIMCDSGAIGLFLYLLIPLSIVLQTFVIYNQRDCPTHIQISAIVAASSVVGIYVTSYTDNAVNYTMATLSYPFAFYGMALGLFEQYKIKSNAV